MDEQVDGHLQDGGADAVDPPLPSAITAPSGLRMMVGAIMEE